MKKEENYINEQTYVSEGESGGTATSLTVGDDANFDKHAFQFVSSLERRTTAAEMYWHGRLIGFGADNAGDWKPYTINFFGVEYSEEEFRRKIEDGEIVINDFNLSVSEAPSYTSNAGSSSLNLDAHILTYRADISATVDGVNKSGTVCITEYIRKTYQSYRTEIDVCP